VADPHLAAALLEALGIEPGTCISLRIDIDPYEARVTVNSLISAKQMGRMTAALAEYDLVPRED
jgi:hypothetical protein